jgi:hypothetical protein
LLPPQLNSQYSEVRFWNDIVQAQQVVSFATLRAHPYMQGITDAQRDRVLDAATDGCVYEGNFDTLFPMVFDELNDKSILFACAQNAVRRVLHSEYQNNWSESAKRFKKGCRELNRLQSAAAKTVTEMIEEKVAKQFLRNKLAGSLAVTGLDENKLATYIRILADHGFNRYKDMAIQDLVKLMKLVFPLEPR